MTSLLSSFFPSEKVWTTEFIEEEREFLRQSLGKIDLSYDDHRWQYYFERFDFIADHFNMVPKAPKDVVIVTFLRNPIARTLSHFKDWRRLQDHDIIHDPPTVQEAKISARELSIGQFLKLDNQFIRSAFHNVQSKSFLLDSHPGREVNCYSQEQLYDLVKPVIEKVNFVGITERSFESINIFLPMIGLDPVQAIPRYNVSDNTIELASEDIDAIRGVNEVDFLIYNEYRQRFDLQFECLFCDLITDRRNRDGREFEQFIHALRKQSD